MSKHRHRRRSKVNAGVKSEVAVEATSLSPRSCETPVEESVRHSGPQLWVHAVVAVVLMGLCASLYTWTADFPLVFDDHTYMMDNPFVKEAGTMAYLKDFDEFAKRPAAIGSDPDYAVNAILRPVAYASFYWNYVFDDFRPRWFRIVNIAIHALNSLLVYALVCSVLGRFVRDGGIRRGSVFFIAATSATLFAVHPLAIESVTYVIQRFTSLVAMFSLLALWLYVLSLENESRLFRWFLRAGAVVATLLGMQTKEIAVTVPALAVVLDWLVFGTRLRSALYRALPLLLCLPLIPGLVILIHSAQSGGTDLQGALNIVNSRDVPIDHWHYIITEFTVVAHYLRQMFWPKGLNLDPEWPMYETFWSTPVVMSFAVLAALIAGAWWMFRRYRSDVRFSLAFASVLWFFLIISISSGLVPLPDFVAEHRSYLPSVGIFIVFACLLDRLRVSSVMFTRWVPVTVVLAVAALSWKTCLRNEVWRTRESLWEDTVAKSPNKYRTWGNLGAAYSDGGKEEKAVECYRNALRLEPQFQNGLLNLSNSLLRLNRPKESLETTMQLIEMDSNATTKPPVAFTLGLGLAGVGRYDEAVSVFRDILATMPNDPQAHKALGLVYYQTGLPHRALDHYRHAAAVQPNDPHLLRLIQAAETAMVQKRGRL